MYTIENNMLRVVVNPLGAELDSIFNKSAGREYLWNGDPAFWSKKSPVLFPIVGTLKRNSYRFDNKNFELGRHGFAREKIFSVSRQSPLSITFELQEDGSTLSVFPFLFSLCLTYSISEDMLSVSYHIKNRGTEKMFFSIGGHPAFKLPIADGLDYNDYYLLFSKTENAGRWPISADGLIEAEPIPLLEHTNQLWLTKSLFYKDAIVFKNLHSEEVQLKSDKHPAGLRFSFKGFPYLGIWAAKDAGFVCIEPWCGIADSVASNQLLTAKEGIIHLPAGEDFERTWSVVTW